jgi:hypothetical protein
MHSTMDFEYRNHALRAYGSDGFYIAKKLLPMSLVEACLEDFAGMMADQLQSLSLPTPPTFFERALALHAADISRYRKVLGAMWRLQSVGDIFAYPAIRNFLKTVFGFGRIFVPGGQTVHVQSQELRIPGGYFGLDAHQDWPSVQGSIDGLGIWVPLCLIDDDSYPLEVVRGSHLSGLKEPAGGKTDAIWVVADYRDDDYEAVCVAPGDVVFISNFTVHRSGHRGRKNFVRLACSSRFDNGAEPTFVQRAYPSAYTRGVHRQLLDFSSVSEVNQTLAAFRRRQ